MIERANNPINDLQQGILQIASGLIHSEKDWKEIKTVHEGAIFIRQQLKSFFDF